MHTTGIPEEPKKRLRQNELIRTYTKKGASSIQHHSFPVVIFMPGSGQQVQTYNNLISQLVSHGYVIVGINSTYSNGTLVLSDGQVVKKKDQYDDNQRLQNLNDLSFILETLPTLPYKNNVKVMMNFKKVALMGHSMGAMNIVQVIKQPYPEKVKAVVLMDPGNVLGAANYPLAASPIPTMVLWSSYFKKKLHGSMRLGKNNFSIELAPAVSSDFSNHENFSDLSTLQYHDAYQLSEIHNAFIDKNSMLVGYGDGYHITKEVNNYILMFLNRNLKNKPYPFIFDECKPLSKNSHLLCG